MNINIRYFRIASLG